MQHLLWQGCHGDPHPHPHPHPHVRPLGQVVPQGEYEYTDLIILFYTILNCTVLCYTIVYYTILNCTVLCYIVLHCGVLHYAGYGPTWLHQYCQHQPQHTGVFSIGVRTSTSDLPPRDIQWSYTMSGVRIHWNWSNKWGI